MRRNPVARPSIAAAGLASALLVSGCKDENRYVPPPPPKVTVATPLQRDVTIYLELNGNVVAVNTVDLVARVQGFLQEIGYTDGANVVKGTNLFTIEPEPYFAKLQQAQAQQAAAKAAAIHAQQEYVRQSTLGKDDFASQSKVDETLADRDQTAANLQNMEAGTQLAAINYSYTHVMAPFPGVVTNHLYSIGELVGGDTATKLATIIQLEPIYVSFNVSELDVLRIREDLAKQATKPDMTKVPVFVGLANETGYPHSGFLNYISPSVDSSTGTLFVRGIFTNEDHALMPGNFVRVRVPTHKQDGAILVPDTALGQDQGGRYVLVVNDKNVVEQRYIQPGPLQADLRIVDKGLAATDRIVVEGIQRAIPGSTVDPQVRTASLSK
jgi:RND family efflux transporter MFP subunit